MFLAQFFPYSCCIGAMLLLSAQCQQSAPAAEKQPATVLSADSLPYDLATPSLLLHLAGDDLKEISALSPTDEPSIFMAVSDERGEALFIDVQHEGAVTNRVLFREKGDFEGTEMVGADIYCLKSDGVLFQVSGWQSGGVPQVQEYPLGTLSKQNDLEGLGYDPIRKTLLVACKEDPASDVPRRIFTFDLQTHLLSDSPVYVINPRDVNAVVPYNDEDKIEHFFSSSGIAVHPITQDVYVISTALKRLVVLDHTTGKIRCAVRLEKSRLPQPEGICFDPAGTLYLSSEGKGGLGSILAFPYRPKN